VNDELTIEEIRDAVKLARIYSPSYTEEEFQASAELIRRLGESGYLEAVRSIARLEREQGIKLDSVMDACEKLVKDEKGLDKKLGDLKVKYGHTRDRAREEEARLNEYATAIKEAQKKLATLSKEAEMEKRRVDKELKVYLKEANLSWEEIDQAKELKAEVDDRSLTLELVLDLVGEFTGYEDSRDELSKGLKMHKSLGAAIKALESDLDRLRAREAEEKTKAEKLEEERLKLEHTVSELRSDRAHAEELRHFFQRYRGVSPLIEHLAAWNQIYFVRCNNPVFTLTGAFSRSAGNAHFFMDKQPSRCPHCGAGSNYLLYDEGPYQALGIPAGTPVRLQLGE